MIKLLRIDSRLIHGQIVEGWMRFCPVDEIMIIDDEICNNDFETRILKFSVPQGVSFEILSVSQAAERWTVIKNSSKIFLILIQSIENLRKLFDSGVDLPEIDMGLVNYTDSKVALTKAVYIDERERKELLHLMEYGVEIVIQTLPSDEKIPLSAILNGKKKK